MRVVHAAALTAAALLLASITSAQGLGDAAAREREKRKATPAKPTKVYTDQEVASTPASAWSDTGSQETPAGGSSDGAETAGAAGPAEELTPEQKAAAEEEKAAAAEAEARAKAEADWRSRLEQERKAEAAHTDRISRLNAELGDLSSISFGAGRARKMSLLDESKQKLAEIQANIAALEEEGRRNAYR